MSAGGRVWCWGDYPQPYIDEVEGVADAHERDDLMDTTQPTLLPFDGVVDVALGREHLCVLLQDERLLCWGANQYGQLGVSPAPTEYSLPQTIPQLDDAVELVLGHTSACAKRSNGSWWCWGNNGGGLFTRRTKWDRWSQPFELALQARVRQLHLQQNQGTLLDTKGNLHVWDGVWQGKCFDGSSAEDDCSGSGARQRWCCELEPVFQKSGERRRFQQLSSFCMLTESKKVVCVYDDPAFMVEESSRFEQISTTIDGGCGLTRRGLVECWRGGYGASVISIEGVPLFETMTLGDNQVEQTACGLTAQGRVWCWTMSMMDRQQPFEVTGVRDLALEDIAAFAGGPFGLCARTQSGSVWCWRGNEEPAEVPELDDAVQLAVGFGFACAIVKDGRVRCWGSNSHGQLGISVRYRPAELNWREAFE
ncbi:MAG: RCC1 domain-containing protein [Myxococcota bacterium]|nr:RCC1 domain-containing protein [Myxococcota bacterium]